MTASYEYQLHESSVATPVWVPLRFPGQYADAESGFFENRNRFFNPMSGRYVSADALLVASNPAAQYMNVPHAYGENSPLNRIDPTGLASKDSGDAASQGEIYSERRCQNGETAYGYHCGDGDFVDSLLSAIDQAAIAAQAKIDRESLPNRDMDWEYSSSIVDVPGRGLVASFPFTDGSTDSVSLIVGPGCVAGVHSHNESAPVPSESDLNRMKSGPAYISQTSFADNTTAVQRLVRWTLVVAVIASCQEVEYSVVRNPESGVEKSLVMQVADALCEQSPTRCPELQRQDVRIARCDARCWAVVFEGQPPVPVDGGVLFRYDDGAGGLVCDGTNLWIHWGAREQGCPDPRERRALGCPATSRAGRRVRYP